MMLHHWHWYGQCQSRCYYCANLNLKLHWQLKSLSHKYCSRFTTTCHGLIMKSIKMQVWFPSGVRHLTLRVCVCVEPSGEPKIENALSRSFESESESVPLAAPVVLLLVLVHVVRSHVVLLLLVVQNLKNFKLDPLMQLAVASL